MRKIGVITTSRADYGIYLPILKKIKAHSELRPLVYVTGAHLSEKFGNTVNLIKKDGFPISMQVKIPLSDTPEGIAKAMGACTDGFAGVYKETKPDIVMALGDRYEMLAAAMAAVPFNIPIAHVHGGESTIGLIDESFRHALTKISHLHFTATKEFADRIIRMGEDPASVHVVGCPRMDIVAEIAGKHPHPPGREWLEQEGVGGHIPLSGSYLLVMQHPVTTEYGHGEEQIMETLAALAELAVPAFMLWPNADAGSEDISRGMRKFRETHHPEHIRFYKNLPLAVFVPLLAHAACMVGNSSAAIREGSFLGIPAVNIGSRQQGRERGGNVTDVGYDRKAIIAAVRKQMEHGKYAGSELYGDGKAGEKIADIVAKAPVKIQKQMTY